MLTRSNRSRSATTIFIWPGESSDTWATGTNRDMGHLSFCGCPGSSTHPVEHLRRPCHHCTPAPQESRGARHQAPHLCPMGDERYSGFSPCDGDELLGSKASTLSGAPKRSTPCPTSTVTNGRWSHGAVPLHSFLTRRSTSTKATISSAFVRST